MNDETDIKCVWEWDDDGFYITECRNTFCFSDDDEYEADFKWCPYCGKELKLVKTAEEQDCE